MGALERVGREPIAVLAPDALRRALVKTNLLSKSQAALTLLGVRSLIPANVNGGVPYARAVYPLPHCESFGRCAATKTDHSTHACLQFQGDSQSK